MAMPRKAAPGLLLSLLLAGSGCGYRFGSMLPRDLRSVHIPPVVNRTGEPLLEDDITRALIQACQFDGSLRVAGREEADAILWAEIIEYSLTPLVFERGTGGRAREYRLALTAEIRLLRRVGGDIVIPPRRVTGEHTFELTSDIASAKRAALPEAAAHLARNVITRMVETW